MYALEDAVAEVLQEMNEIGEHASFEVVMLKAEEKMLERIYIEHIAFRPAAAPPYEILITKDCLQASKLPLDFINGCLEAGIVHVVCKYKCSCNGTGNSVRLLSKDICFMARYEEEPFYCMSMPEFKAVDMLFEEHGKFVLLG